jgi:hypothetical protein
MANATVYILGGIGILPKFVFYLLIYKGRDQIINPIPQYETRRDWNLTEITKCMFCLLISGRKDQVIIPVPQYLY